MPRSEQRQDAAADHAGIGEDADPAALGETARPAADGRQAQAAGVLDLAHDGADGVQVRGDGPVRTVAAALERRPDGAATGQFERDSQLRQPFGDIAHDGVGEAGRAGYGQHFQQHALHVVEVRLG